MEKIKPGKQRLPAIENKNILQILFKITNESKNSNQIANELSKQQSGIYKQLIKLKEEDIVYQDKENKFILNYKFLINELIDSIYSQGEPAQRNYLIIKLENNKIYPENNKYLIELIKTSLKYASEEPDSLLNYMGNKEIGELTLSDIFSSIIKIFVASDLSATIEQFFFNRYLDLNLSNEQHNNIDKEDYPELFILKEIILDCKSLWLDFDENLEGDIRNNILDLVQKEEFKLID